MDETQALQLHQGRGHLLQDGADVPQRQWAELTVLQEIVKVLLEHFKHQTCVTLVLETLVGADKVELVSFLRTQPVQYAHLEEMIGVNDK